MEDHAFVAEMVRYRAKVRQRINEAASRELEEKLERERLAKRARIVAEEAEAERARQEKVKQLRERKKRAKVERREKKRLAKERHEAEVRERERREQRSGLNGGDSQRSVMKPVSNSSTSGAKKNEVAVRVGVVAGPAVE